MAASLLWDVIVSGPWIDREAWLGIPSDVALARRFVSLSLKAHDMEGLGTAISLVASELCTNAVLHARTPFSVSLERRIDLVLIEVIDGGSTYPESRGLSAEYDHGRGLQIVQGMSSAWGVWPRRDGKSVWASFSLAESDLPPGDEHGW